jgi:hypothetical protein
MRPVKDRLADACNKLRLGAKREQLAAAAVASIRPAVGKAIGALGVAVCTLCVVVAAMEPDRLALNVAG